MKTLPPKRFEDPYDPIFDSIRHEGWFGKLLKRRAKNHALRAGLELWRDWKRSQKEASEAVGVDPRELRDYAMWVNKTPRKAISVAEQAILDGAYILYSGMPMVYGSGAINNPSFGWCIRHESSLFGTKGRPIEEMWEIRHDFWPSNYARRGQ